MDSSEFKPLDAAQKQNVATWLHSYINAPHPELGRDGPICPFVEPSIRADSMVTRAVTWRAGEDERPTGALDTMVRHIHDAMDLFSSLTWPSRNATLHGLVVIFEAMPRENWWLIDEGHRVTKDAAVARGLMLGQFHPDCTAPAARNPLFPVNRGPYPTIAVRNMAFHDILFLHDRPDWFEHYRKRYDRYYTAAAKIDPHFAELYAEAVRVSETRPVTPPSVAGEGTQPPTAV